MDKPIPEFDPEKSACSNCKPKTSKADFRKRLHLESQKLLMSNNAKSMRSLQQKNEEFMLDGPE